MSSEKAKIDIIYCLISSPDEHPQKVMNKLVTYDSCVSNPICDSWIFYGCDGLTIEDINSFDYLRVKK